MAVRVCFISSVLSGRQQAALMPKQAPASVSGPAGSTFALVFVISFFDLVKDFVGVFAAYFTIAKAMG